MKILEEFWYGNIQPNEREVVPGSRFAKLLQLVAKNEDKLAPLLSEDAKAVFEKIQRYSGRVVQHRRTRFVCAGLSLGSKVYAGSYGGYGCAVY